MNTTTIDESYPATVLNHKNQKILYFQYRDCKNHKEMVAKYVKQMEIARESTDVKLLCFDYIDSSIGTEYMKIAKANTDLWDNFKIALIGVIGIKKILLMGYNRVAKRELKPFNTKEEALEYLAQ